MYTRLLDEVYEMLCICIYDLFNNLTVVNTTWSSSNNTEIASSVGGLNNYILHLLLCMYMHYQADIAA